MSTVSDVFLFGVPGLGMILVSLLAVVVWRRASGSEFRWFWAGAAVSLKVAFSLLANQTVVTLLKRAFPRLLFFPATGLFLGTVSAAFEVGLTWLAGRRWRQLGLDPGRAIAVGVGAGAFESLVLGSVIVLSWLASAVGEDAGDARSDLLARAAVTPLFWLEPPAGRIIALLGHVSSRALVLLCIANRRPWMVLSGFAAFVLVDGTGGALLLSQVFAGRSMWWIDAATLPFNLFAVTLLVWCIRRRHGRSQSASQLA
jgi:hypothetical protein